jgi:hypothetical protein
MIRLASQSGKEGWPVARVARPSPVRIAAASLKRSAAIRLSAEGGIGQLGEVPLADQVDDGVARRHVVDQNRADTVPGAGGRERRPGRGVGAAGSTQTTSSLHSAAMAQPTRRIFSARLRSPSRPSSRHLGRSRRVR